VLAASGKELGVKQPVLATKKKVKPFRALLQRLANLDQSMQKFFGAGDLEQAALRLSSIRGIVEDQVPRQVGLFTKSKRGAF